MNLSHNHGACAIALTRRAGPSGLQNVSERSWRRSGDRLKRRGVNFLLQYNQYLIYPRNLIAHQDCDDVEPADKALTAEMLSLFDKQGLRAIPATPAWEMEAWWFLWPDAALHVNSAWRKPSRTGQRVGLIRNAKEAFRRALRPQTKRRTRDYSESDSPRIAHAVFELGIINDLDAVSHSFERFRDMLIGCGI